MRFVLLHFASGWPVVLRAVANEMGIVAGSSTDGGNFASVKRVVAPFFETIASFLNADGRLFVEKTGD